MRLSWLAVLVVVLLLPAGCGGDGGPRGTGGPGGPGGPAGGPGGGAPEGGAEAFRMVEKGPEITVALDLQLDSRKRGTVSFLGVEPSKIEGGWIRAGQRPDFFWTSPEISLVGAVAVKAPLPVGLTYFALVNQDSDPVPSEGDLTSRPVAYTDGGELALIVDGRFGERRAPTAGPGPGTPGGQGHEGLPAPDGESGSMKRPVAIDLPPDLRPTGPTVLIVVGRRPGPPGAPAKPAPDYLWRSTEFTAASWPHHTELPLPSGMAIQVLLDADGDKLPSAGDPATGPDEPFGDGPVGSTLGLRLEHRFEPGEAGGDGGQRPAPGLPPATAAGGEVRRLELTSKVRLPFIRTGRFMVAGLAPAEPFRWPPAARPEFLWVSEPTMLEWPVTLDAALPDGLDMIVVLDLDGSGLPGPGDLSSRPVARYQRGDAGPPEVVQLQEVIPTQDPG